MKIDTYIMKIKKRIELSDSKYPMPGEYVIIRNNIYYCVQPVEYNRCTECDLLTLKMSCFGTDAWCCKNSIHNVIFKKYE